jgi:hypothetical protein
MNQEIRAENERVAHDLYERSGREEGKDLVNWLAAEKIVLGRLALSSRIAGEDAGAKKPSSRSRGRNERKRHAASNSFTKGIVSQRLGGDRIPFPIKPIPRARRTS